MNRTGCLVPLALAMLLPCCASLCPFCNDAEPAENVRVASVFSDNMVLQRDREIPVWGWGKPEGRVIVTLSRPGSDEALRSAKATVRSDRSWEARLPAVECNPADRTPYILAVHGAKPILFKNILMGDVWVCSGQSNMELPLTRVRDAEGEIAAADWPAIRLLTIPRATSPVPENDVTTDGWVSCSPETVGDFSAVGYLFGRDLHQHLGVPIGLIHTSWGGTPAEAWTSTQGLSRLADYRDDAALLASLSDKKEAERQATLDTALAAWRDAIRVRDTGFLRDGEIWKPAPLPAETSPTMELPGLWSGTDLESFDGAAWFSRTFDLQPGWADRPAAIHLGPIDDQDDVFINGRRVGGTDKPGYWQTPRIYQIPPGTLRDGTNTVWVRVVDTGGEGGLSGSAEELRIEANETHDLIPLAGLWHYRRGISSRDYPPRPRLAATPSHRPAHLYNAMIAPLIPYAIRGAIWYQGESNASRAYQYRDLFPEMIRDWRRHWKQGDFPFLFVQLANFMARRDQPAESAWAELREAQAIALELPATGMAVIIDIGEADNIHPKNKQDVGKRLALAAQAIVYGEPIIYSGPVYRAMKVEEKTIRLSFDHTGSGLMARSGDLTGFAIAGKDRRFVWARARIDRDSVVVSSPEVLEPVAVRYAWADNPAANLVNAEGLPASPFRTDSWPGVTANNH